jgi:hypothetical protein
MSSTGKGGSASNAIRRNTSKAGKRGGGGMGRPGKPAKKGSSFKRGNASTNPHRKAPSKESGNRKKGTTLRDKSDIKRINMYKSGAPVRNKKGKIVHGGAFHDKSQVGGRDITKMTGRTAPNRKWFGNTRVVGQAQLDKFREEITAQVHDPYQVILRQSKVPMGLISDNSSRTGDGSSATSSTSNLSANERKGKLDKQPTNKAFIILYTTLTQKCPPPPSLSLLLSCSLSCER